MVPFGMGIARTKNIRVELVGQYPNYFKNKSQFNYVNDKDLSDHRKGDHILLWPVYFPEERERGKRRKKERLKRGSPFFLSCCFD